MYNRIKRYVSLGLSIFMGIQLTGCAGSQGTDSVTSGQDKNSQKEEAVVYYEEEKAFPEYSSMTGEYIHEGILYYAAASYDEEEETVDTGIYSFDPSGISAEPVRLAISFGDQEYVQDMAMDHEGMIYTVLGALDEGKGEEVQEGTGEQIYIRKHDMEGNVMGEHDITSCFAQAEYAYVSAFEVDDAGRMYFTVMNEEVVVLDEKGTEIFRNKMEGTIAQLSRSKDGQVAAARYGDQGIEIREIDGASGEMGKKYNIPQMFQIFMAEGMESDLLIASDSTLYDYSRETGRYTSRFNWSDLDLVVEFHSSIFNLDDGGILLLNKEFSDTSVKTEAFVIRKGEPGQSNIAETTVITFGELALFSNPAVRNAIAEFNRAHDGYRIEIVEYGKEDYSEGLTRLNGDIVNGSGPDILFLPLTFSMDLYAGKGVLEDLYPYIDGDEELNREDFIPNILAAYETGEKLYGMPIVFSLYTMLGKSSVIGEREGWTLDEMIAFADKHQNVNIFSDASKSGVFRLCRYANWDRLVDWNDTQEPFNRELFIKMLRFADRFTDDDKYQYDENFTKNITESQLLLLDTNLSSVAIYQMGYYLFGEAVSHVGYPSEEGSGNVIGSSATIAMNAGSSHKDIAWAFIRTLLSEEFHEQNDLNQFSIRKDGLERQFASAMEPLYDKDGEGNEVEQPKSSVTMGNGEYSFAVDIYAASEEEIEALRSLIHRADRIRESDPGLSTIINEEIPYFFSGEKSAEEVADVVAGRVRIYVNESK